MDRTLTRLLDAEARAEALVQAAEGEKQGLIMAGHEEAGVLVREFEERLPGLRAALAAQSESQATEKLDTLQRQFAAEQTKLQQSAARMIRAAAEVVVAMVIDPRRS